MSYPKQLLAVEVRFVGNNYYASTKTYTYVRPPKSDLHIPQVGDYIITSTAWPRADLKASASAKQALELNTGVARIVRVFWVDAPTNYRFYVASIPASKMEANFEEAQAFSQRASRVAELKKQLDELLTSPEVQFKWYEQLANVCPEARPLVNELKKLT